MKNRNYVHTIQRAMNSLFLTGLIVLLSAGFANAQSSAYDSQLLSKGDVPIDFRGSSTTRSTLQIEKAEVSQAETEQMNDFVFESTFSLDRLLHSGQVSFNDTVSQYLSKVLDKLLKDEPALRANLRIYTLKSPMVNAFSTHQGIILVSLGLLERLDNEAQLAFILAHEITHYRKKHSFNSYVYDKELDEGAVFQSMNMEEKHLSKLHYSRQNETEADIVGLALFASSDYDLSEALPALRFLQYTHLPARNQEFDKSFLESPWLHFPADLVLAEVDSIKPEDIPDSLSSHPGIPSRIDSIQKRLMSDHAKELGAGSEYLVGADYFKAVKEIAQLEICQLYYQNDRYEKAIYAAYTLLKDKPDNPLLKKLVAHSLYMIASYANVSDRWYYHIRYDRIQGPAQGFFYMMEQLDEEELTVLALSYNQQLRKELPEDDDLLFLEENLVKQLFQHHHRGIATVDSMLQNRELEKAQQKGSRLRELMEEATNKERLASESMLENQLETYYRNPASKELFEQYLPQMDSLDQLEPTMAKGKLELAPSKKKVDHVLVVDPFYAMSDIRTRKKFDKPRELIESEKGEQKLIRYLNKQSKSDLKISVLDASLFGANNVEAFNALGQLQSWRRRMVRHTDVELSMFDTRRVDELSERLGTSHFCWMGTFAGRRKRSAAIVVGSIILPIYLPWGIYELSTKPYDNVHVSFTLNAENGEMEQENVRIRTYNKSSNIMKQDIRYTLEGVKEMRY